MRSPEEYQRHADELRERAETARGPAKRMLLDLSRIWDRLAGEAAWMAEQQAMLERQREGRG